MTRNAANDGRSFQKFLDLLFAEYERLGIASIRKVDPPTRVVGTGKLRKVIFMANPWLDYAGVINGGRMVAIEAKSTEAKVLPIETPGRTVSGIKMTQQATAMRLQRMGAVVFYLWRCKDDVRIATPNMVAAAGKQLRWCDAMPMPRGPGALAFDPLAAFAHLQAPELPTAYPGA